MPTVTFSAEDIRKIIKDFNLIKAHWPDNISICMLKICNDSICAPLEINFKQAFY